MRGIGITKSVPDKRIRRVIRYYYAWQMPVVRFENTPPTLSVSDAETRYVVGTSPTGDWVGENNNIAEWTGYAWKFIDAEPGLVVYDLQTKTLFVCELVGIGPGITWTNVSSSLTNVVLQDGTKPLTADWDVGGYKITNLATPTVGSDAVNKDYADSLVNGLDWQESVLDRYDPTSGLPASPSVGDRYLATATANGWTVDNIYECTTASSWTGATETVAQEGMAVFVEDEDKAYMYYDDGGGASWELFGSIISHNALSGLQGGTSSEYYHLTSAEHTGLTTGVSADSYHTHAHDNTTSISGGAVGDYYHLTQSEYNTLTNADSTIDNADGEHKHAELDTWTYEVTGTLGGTATDYLGLINVDETNDANEGKGFLLTVSSHGSLPGDTGSSVYYVAGRYYSTTSSWETLAPLGNSRTTPKYIIVGRQTNGNIFQLRALRTTGGNTLDITARMVYLGPSPSFVDNTGTTGTGMSTPTTTVPGTEHGSNHESGGLDEITVEGEGQVASTGETASNKFLRTDGDDTSSWQEVEGTDIASTGETGGNKYLREDGDDTSSWQQVEGTDIASTGVATADRYLRTDGDGTCSWQSGTTDANAIHDNVASEIQALTSVTSGLLGGNDVFILEEASASYAKRNFAWTHIDNNLNDGLTIDFDNLTNKPTGLSGGATHDDTAHTNKVRKVFVPITAMTESDGTSLMLGENDDMIGYEYTDTGSAGNYIVAGFAPDDNVLTGNLVFKLVWRRYGGGAPATLQFDYEVNRMSSLSSSSSQNTGSINPGISSSAGQISTTTLYTATGTYTTVPFYFQIWVRRNSGGTDDFTGTAQVLGIIMEYTDTNG